MISLPNPTSKMTKTTPNFSTVVENYAKVIIDGMDDKTLEQFAFDTLVNSLTQDYETVDEIIDEIRDQYDEETVNYVCG